MVKRMLIFVVTFAIALGGTTAVVVMRTKPAAPATGLPANDSTMMAATRGSSSVPDSIAPGDSAKTVKDSTPVVGSAAAPARDSVRPVAVPAPVRDLVKPLAKSVPIAAIPTAAQPLATAAPPLAPATSILAGGRLSKIFSAMSARDAAKVLEQMDDPDVKEILGRLNDKKAAEILALLPTARAALISKAALANPGTSK
jgi:hypothetical protein